MNAKVVSLACTVPLLAMCYAAACSTGTGASNETMQPVPTGQGTLIIQIEGLRDSTGWVNVSVFDVAEGFPQDSTRVYRSATVKLASAGEVTVTFEGLSYGDYAIAVLHDANGNGRLDTGLLGIPSEGFGFSNNPRPGFGAPSFESCRFRFDRPQVTLRLGLRYF
jgi:uncharacterized protein (DUF2141 family)